MLLTINNKQWEGFCELEKAFNFVHRDILLSKLKFCGINGKNFAHNKFYLHNRHIRTAMHYDSDKSDTVSGRGNLTCRNTRF